VGSFGLWAEPGPLPSGIGPTVDTVVRTSVKGRTMGIFKKAKDSIGAGMTAQAGPGQIGVQGMPVDPALLGGPSTQPLAADDPMLQPVNGIGLADYAAVAKEAQSRGVTDEVGMDQVASEMGYDPAVFGPAVKEWIDRMGTSMVVGQEFRRQLGY